MNTPDIGKFHKQITAVGSRVTCEPPVTGTDQDWLVRVESIEDYDLLADYLLLNGWEIGGSRVPEDVNYLPESQRFNSFVKGDDNVIITKSDEFHRRFLAASAMAKHLNLLKKEDRISLFQAVLYGVTFDPNFQPWSPFDDLTPAELEGAF